MMPSASETYIVVIARPGRSDSIASRLPRTLSHGRVDGLYRLPHPEVPARPAGTSPYAILRKLGNPQSSLRSLDRLHPAHVRELRNYTFSARRSGKTTHLVGMVDNESPYGNRRLLEEIIRSLRTANLPVQIHLGGWHPTPREFRYGLEEIMSLCDSNVQLASVFPWASHGSFDEPFAFADALKQSTRTERLIALEWPLARPVVLKAAAIQPGDHLFIADHELHGFCDLERELQSLGSGPTFHFLHDDSLEEPFGPALDKSRHVMAITNRLQYSRAYFGTQPHHPYFESLQHDEPSQLLEMLISPHFGYTQRPYRTVVMLDESSHDFDWLLSSYVKSVRHHPYVCCLVDPARFDKSLVVTNKPIDRTASIYEQLHCYRDKQYVQEGVCF